MFSVTQYWNPKQKQFLELLQNDNTFDKAILICIELHNQLHDLENKVNQQTIYQNLLKLVTSDISKYRPKNTFSSIAWNVWHITRIEDAITNILINDTDEVLNKKILTKLSINITDTGNAFSVSDVDDFSNQINFSELLKYRRKVGINTLKILEKLTINDRKRKPTREQLQKLIQQKVVTQSKDSMWLIDFWSKKTVSGLLTMPITRHQIVHINDCFKIIEKFMKDKPNN